MAFGIHMVGVMTFGIQMFGTMTVEVETLEFKCKILRVKTFGIQMFGVMTDSNVWSGQVRCALPATS